MSINDAHKFVEKLREDHKFRNEASRISNTTSMKEFIKTNDFDFEISRLVEAMADCMNEMEKTMKE
jgi:hypothetical protein